MEKQQYHFVSMAEAKKLKKGDKIVLTSFGAGFIWGSVYLKWGYNPEDVQEIPETLNDTEDAE